MALKSVKTPCMALKSVKTPCMALKSVKTPYCQVSYATEAVMSSCHGRRKCSIGADVGTFGKPGCPPGTRLFLKVVHTCGIILQRDLHLCVPVDTYAKFESYKVFQYEEIENVQVDFQLLKCISSLSE
ncbi:hypothetical protein NPIL_270741 [Nephila pilipes]|uniref:SUEL-type lectin domain-containing protein n=1 Tax=Nephila pilipes TaxID=299642 RepID=A0A8X6TEI3_NEPPI|nr:hypothetical protein NPIL_270741 [Nephila pilipes]